MKNIDDFLKDISNIKWFKNSGIKNGKYHKYILYLKHMIAIMKKH